ncbi:MAG: hypothetical protein NT016_01620 [Candidatus Aenigmarchaeota archaeon]|nr:hypothetical protein [Candidatus Aenigmarchaeota archaeon]
MPRNARSPSRKRKIGIRRTIVEAFAVMKAKPVVLVPPLLIFMLSMASSAAATLDNVIVTVAAMVPLFVAEIFVSVLGIRTSHAAIKGRAGLGRSAGEAWRLLPRSLGYTVLLLVIMLGVMVGDAVVAVLIGYATGSQSALAAVMIAAMLVSLVYLTTKLSFTMYGIVIDNKEVVASIRASWKMTRGVFVNLVLLQLALGAITLLIYVPVYISEMLYTVGGGTAFMLISLFASMLAVTLMVPLNVLAMIIAYQKLKR